ncbi:hypothetical protein QFZ49_004310 [Streptomyces turgidiscabies]|uniref:Uncharacterized protein n=1 Tax=Streptomyces turgidiscabies TaxID=85558 RepID=A0ABU0RQW4_9ACTN|nr:hypothetical protein [Streptomyces turgidiscabies]
MADPSIILDELAQELRLVGLAPHGERLSHSGY